VRYTISMKYILIPLAFVGILLASLTIERPAPRDPLSPSVQSLSYVSVGSTTISVEVADTQGERTQGLSGRTTLPEGHGMLFVFEREGDWGIWMKDMKFSIDIIWMNREGNIITIARDVAPQTYPNAFYPTQPALYVLEVPAGFSDKNGVAEGMGVVLKLL